MTKERKLFLVGVWVAILPFLGLFESWRKILFVLTGIGIIYLAYLFYNEAKVRSSKDENVIKSFIDNIGSGE